MPHRFLCGTTLNCTIGAFLSEHKNDKDCTLFGFILPPFQRGSVWNQDQQIKFMESVWLQLPIGSYMVNMRWDMGEFDNWLLDGQQRMRALKSYLNNEFSVFGYFFSEITEIDKRRFRNLPFPRIEVDCNDLDRLKEIYNRFNFGGTPHKPEEMAK